MSAVPKPAIDLRQYQLEARDAIRAALAEGIQKQLVVLPTGTGKTRLFAAIPDALGFGRFDVTLVVAHVNELIDQAANAFEEIGCWVEREKAEKRASPMSRIVVGSVQTLRPARAKEFFERFKGRVRCLVIDEAHRAASKTYRELVRLFFEYVPDGLLLGVTATPKRTDNIALGTVFERIVYAMDIDDAIDGGYLVPIEAYRAVTTADLRGVKKSGDDYDREALAAAVNTSGRNRVVTEAFAKVVGKRQAIVFAASVPHAKALAASLCEAGFDSRTMWGEMGDDERKEAVSLFREKKIQVLTCFGLLVEGFDVPGVEAVVMARPTQSEVVFRQAIGRGLRPHPTVAHRLGPATTADERRALIAASPKTKAVILDIVDVTDRQRLLTVPTLFGLPPKLDLNGRNPMKVRETYVKARERNPDEAAVTEDVVRLEAIAEVDLFAPPKLADDVAKVTTLDWRLALEGVYRLRLPAISRARTRTGDVIEQYASRIRDSIKTFSRAGSADPVAAAFEELNVDPNSVESYEIYIDVTENALGQFQVWRARNNQRKLLGEVQRRAEAFMRAEEWVRKSFPEIARVASRNAKWRVESITPKQEWRLTKKLGVKAEHLPKTKGEASALIDMLEAKKGQLRAG